MIRDALAIAARPTLVAIAALAAATLGVAASPTRSPTARAVSKHYHSHSIHFDGSPGDRWFHRPNSPCQRDRRSAYE